ncbi:MAG: hypothetical protein IKN73_02200 [Alphaproteobacteria bacterium]|nr:hypothetical protein [Alphaproteobacteria bacterium]
MKFKIFAFFLVFLCTPLVAFGLCSEATQKDQCNGECKWSPDDNACVLKCKTDFSDDYGVEYDSATEQIEQSDGCITEGSVTYSCDNGKWVVISNFTEENCKPKDDSSGLKKFICKDGYYRESIQSKCKTCPDLQYVNKDRTGCMTCNPGTYYDSSDRECKECPEGYTCSNGKQSTTACSDGTYSNGTTCVTCETGYSCKNGIKKACAAGKYQGETGQTECKPCGKGEYQNEPGQTSCKPCAVGTHQNYEGQESCSICEPGTYQHETGQEECKPCDSGYFCPGNIEYKNIQDNNNFKTALERDNIITDKDYKKGIMYECPIGFYSNYAKDPAEPRYRNYCIPCPSSKTNTQTGSASCDTYLFTNLTFKVKNDDRKVWNWEGLSKTLEVSNNIYNVKLKAEQ